MKNFPKSQGHSLTHRSKFLTFQTYLSPHKCPPNEKQCQHMSNPPDALADKNMKKVTKPIVGHIGIEEVIKKYITH